MIAVLYGQKLQFGSQFIHSSRSIIQELHKISAEISAELPLDFKHGTQRRTSKLSMGAASTLHFKLHQVIMLDGARLILIGNENPAPRFAVRSRSTIPDMHGSCRQDCTTETSDNVIMYDALTIAPPPKKYERKIMPASIVAGTWTSMVLMAKYRSYVQEGKREQN